MSAPAHSRPLSARTTSLLGLLGSESTGGRAFFQQRFTDFSRVLLLLGVTFYFVRWGLDAVLQLRAPFNFTSLFALSQSAQIVLFAGVWLGVRRRKLQQRTLYAMDAI